MSTTWTTISKTGNYWEYNQAGFTYNQATDPATGDTIYYNTIGDTTDWANQSKS